MFKTLRAIEEKNLNHSGRSYLGETLQLEGDLRSSGNLDVSGLINGNVFVSEITIKDTGSIRGSIEAAIIEVYGHVEGKITADVVIIGKGAVILGQTGVTKSVPGGKSYFGTPISESREKLKEMAEIKRFLKGRKIT